MSLLPDDSEGPNPVRIIAIDAIVFVGVNHASTANRHARTSVFNDSGIAEQHPSAREGARDGRFNSYLVLSHQRVIDGC